jgi:hypothetical protein
MGRKTVKRVLVLAYCLLAGISVPASALPGPVFDGAAAAPAREVPVQAQQRRCVPSRCACRGSLKTRCSRDCRRDLLCSCVHGKYVCTLYVAW